MRAARLLLYAECVFESVCCLLFCTFVIKQLLNAKFEYTNRIVAFTSHIRIAHISTTVARQHFRWIRKHLHFTMCLSNSQFTHTKCEPNILLFFPLFPVSISPRIRADFFVTFSFGMALNPWVVWVPYAFNGVCSIWREPQSTISVHTKRLRCSSFIAFSHVSIA